MMGVFDWNAFVPEDQDHNTWANAAPGGSVLFTKLKQTLWGTHFYSNRECVKMAWEVLKQLSKTAFTHIKELEAFRVSCFEKDHVDDYD